MSAPLTYVYCLVRAARPPSLRRAPSGMPGGGALRALEAGTHLWLIVSSVPEREYGEAVLQKGLQRLDWVGQRAVAHEAVVEHFLSSSALVPMPLFTLFTSDRRAVEHVVRDRGRLARILARVEGHLEWGLRLTWDERSARDRAGETGRAGEA
ncbi:MAG: GvpL/GvpF family gas vesicle protein, partial [Acidobacteria bacterium]|nr:GvpL/GvpF family gas vesicle protein [Acidobacteriota bacterium]